MLRSDLSCIDQEGRAAINRPYPGCQRDRLIAAICQPAFNAYRRADGDVCSQPLRSFADPLQDLSTDRNRASRRIADRRDQAPGVNNSFSSWRDSFGARREAEVICINNDVVWIGADCVMYRNGGLDAERIATIGRHTRPAIWCHRCVWERLR